MHGRLLLFYNTIDSDNFFFQFKVTCFNSCLHYIFAIIFYLKFII